MNVCLFQPCICRLLIRSIIFRLYDHFLVSVKSRGYTLVSLNKHIMSQKRVFISIYRVCLRLIRCKPLIISFLLIVIFPARSLACTVFSVEGHNRVFAGTSEDWGGDWSNQKPEQASMWVLPAEPGKYGRIILGWNNLTIESGMNEAGLMYDFVATDTSDRLPPQPNKSNYDGVVGEKMLESCKTVDEAIILYQEFLEPCLGVGVVFIADAQGDSALIGWDFERNDISVIRKTNEPLFFGAGSRILQSIFEQEREEALATLMHQKILIANVAQKSTAYSGIYDLREKKLHLAFNQDFDNFQVIDLETELANGKRTVFLADLYSEQVSGHPVQIFSYFSPGEKVIYISIVMLLLLCMLFWPVLIVKRDEFGQFEFLSLVGAIAFILLFFHNVIGALLYIYYGNAVMRHGFDIVSPIYRYYPITFALSLIVFAVVVNVFRNRRIWSFGMRAWYSVLLLPSLCVFAYNSAYW